MRATQGYVNCFFFSFNGYRTSFKGTNGVNDESGRNNNVAISEANDVNGRSNREVEVGTRDGELIPVKRKKDSRGSTRCSSGHDAACCREGVNQNIAL